MTKSSSNTTACKKSAKAASRSTPASAARSTHLPTSVPAASKTNRSPSRAVGDGSDRDLPLRQLGPEVLEHFLRNRAVEAADGVAVGRGIEGQHGHGEGFVAVGGVAAADGHQLLEIDRHFPAVFGEVVV